MGKQHKSVKQGEKMRRFGGGGDKVCVAKVGKAQDVREAAFLYNNNLVW